MKKRVFMESYKMLRLSQKWHGMEDKSQMQQVEKLST